MAAKADSSSYNLLYLSTFGHPILGNKTYTNNHSRNEILRNRFEKRSNNMDLPIFQYRYSIYKWLLCVISVFCNFEKCIYSTEMKFLLSYDTIEFY